MKHISARKETKRDVGYEKGVPPTLTRLLFDVVAVPVFSLTSRRVYFRAFACQQTVLLTSLATLKPGGYMRFDGVTRC